jgi:hypothetical protein
VTGESAKIPLAIEGSGLIIDAVDDHRDERESLASVVGVPQHLGEQAALKAVTLAASDLGSTGRG